MVRAAAVVAAAAIAAVEAGAAAEAVAVAAVAVVVVAVGGEKGRGSERGACEAGGGDGSAWRLVLRLTVKVARPAPAPDTALL